MRLTKRLGEGEHWKGVWYCVHVSGDTDLVNLLFLSLAGVDF